MDEKNKIYVSEFLLNEQQEYINKIKTLVSKKIQDKENPLFCLTRTYGCQQNENDTERINGMLIEMGFTFTDDVKEADVIIYNTCAVREHAEQKVFGNIGALVQIKREKPSLIIGLCGCMMQQEHIVNEIASKYRHVNLIFGTHAL
ncbi:MAG: tRNA-i(6)A37 thiotransferase enzyme MiaB, partial [Clostridia bacterium]|nr:tRNA-i(6)A37 thiotransferase enzyme MiaB [Clostridia bacterium]